MRINKCDICRKNLSKDKNTFYISAGHVFGGYDICNACAKPLEKFMTENKLGEVNK